MAGPIAVELAIQSAFGASLANDHRLTSIEVAPGLALGGLTPSPGLVLECLRLSTGTRVNVLIRPRQGGFVYTEPEKSTMLADLEWLTDAVRSTPGAPAGIVIGALTESGEPDAPFLREILARVDGIPVTFHRAIDQCEYPVDAARALADLGVARILSSGGASEAGQGIGVLASMQEAAPEVEIAAGGGLKIADIPALVDAGIQSVHLSAKEWTPGVATGVSLGAADAGGDNGYFETSPTQVAQLIETAQSYGIRRG
ncbi:copper homeostasis protein CutC [Haematomicrobium sanguinis]|uniref:copper homeostasis protein CutC n=1 Tax=Haematomicrobium sanguinis TaxID=479106 RepID=UPI00047B6D11|nr:copper homeostasis protein CutC [Haematomicrobium sanguinis]